MSSDDERLLARLGAALRDRERRDEAAGGALPRELSDPLSASFRNALAERALEAQGRVAPAAPPPPVTPPSPVAPRPPVRRSRRLLGPAFVLALAAAAAWLLWPRGLLPAYTLALEGGDATARGGPAPDAAGRVVLASGSRIEIVLRPATPVEGPVQAHLYMDGDPPAPLEAAVEVAPSGAVRWSGTAGQLVGPRTGDVDVLLVVARPSAQPAPAEIARQPDGGGRSWQSFRVRLRVISER